ncbi:hypothetical protein E6O75_ATG06974 [Venturia nashicola]|uniref:BTB domain-containing protein n=1 Tax=Venturia nashicola TaxID=86259 RepID=A0A4Z1P0Q8_9PEZI|nr:hypothetical protein E6O75_ATG06974 [Venturia nashicola]
MATNALEVLRAVLGGILLSSAFSDLILRDKEGRVFNAHKAIVCAHSKFFEKACEPGKFKEGEESTISLTIGESTTISLLLEFLYTLDYGYHLTEGQAVTPLLLHLRLYIAADFYNVPKLKEVAATRFQHSLNGVSLTGNEISKAVEEIYTNIPSCDHVLRDMVLKVILDNISACLNTAPNNSSLTIAEIMAKLPEFGKDLTMRMSAELDRLRPIEDRWDGQGYRKVQCQAMTCLHTWADARSVIPDGTHCPKCGVPKNSWDSFRVE